MLKMIEVNVNPLVAVDGDIVIEHEHYTAVVSRVDDDVHVKIATCMGIDQKVLSKDFAKALGEALLEISK